MLEVGGVEDRHPKNFELRVVIRDARVLLIVHYACGAHAP